MSPVSRRTLTYWLLLLVPTLAVGLGAIQLLRREQARLAGQSALAESARRAGVTARAGLIVENVELLVGDMRTGLLETLAAMPAAGLGGELDRWRRTNPLVRMGFLCEADGRVVFPPAATADEESRGFRRRAEALFATGAPWRLGAAPPAAAPAFELADSASRDERAARQQASSNVAQVQSARRDAQVVSKLREYSPRSAASETDAPAAKDQSAATLATIARQGWVPWTVDGRMHLLGWLELGGAVGVRGVELEVAALVARLGGALPAETNPGEGYALRDDRGRIMHQAGWVPAEGGTVVARLPVAAAVLPGWEIVAFLAAPDRSDPAGSSFILLGTLLVGILVVAILAGGSLLFWQARQSEAEAAQKTSFVANVSHEFKTPLTTIRLYAELLEQGRVPDDAKRGEYLRTIGRETQRLARLVGNALDFSRLEQGKKKYAREPLDLAAELGRLLDTQAPRLAEAGLVLRREGPAVPLPVTADRDAIEQIVLNLFDNAVKYAGAGGEVVVELAAGPAGGATVRVLDRGPGVPAEHRERIFEKFHRVDDTLTAAGTGTGLGLSIARQLARGLGGELRHEPRAGGGASFILELP